MFKKLGTGLLLGALTFVSSTHAYTVTESMSEDAIKARLQPPGLPTLEATGLEALPAKPEVAAHPGKRIYDSSCTACHSIGVAGAPKKGDKAAWDPRLKKGMEILIKHIHEGFNAMPPGGACPQCSSQDYEQAIHYMSGTD